MSGSGGEGVLWEGWKGAGEEGWRELVEGLRGGYILLLVFSFKGSAHLWNIDLSPFL